MKLIKYKNLDKLEVGDDGCFYQPPSKSLSLLFGFFYIHWGGGSFWFRFFGGYGVSGRNDKPDQFILFSERIGAVKTYKMFGWTFKILK